MVNELHSMYKSMLRLLAFYPLARFDSPFAIQKAFVANARNDMIAS